MVNRRDRLAWSAMAALLGAGEVTAQDHPYPEAQRFDTSEFHEGLKKRGLTDLLALHLLEHPPADPVDAALLARDIKLAESADPSRGPAERSAAIGEANRLLEELIAQHPSHGRVDAWQMELGASLLYTEADRYTSSILYRGGSTADRAALLALMDRAVDVIAAVHGALADRCEALDRLPARQYDALEGTGKIDKLESDFARADYMLAWARFYRAMARHPSDVQRPKGLRLVIEYLDDRSGLLHVPHGETHFQGQALLLAGMSYRLLDEQRTCRVTLEQAIDVVTGILDQTERDELSWVVALARIELVRSYRDGGEFARARQGLEIFREETRRAAPGDFGRSVIVALLERSVFRTEADRAEADGRHDQAAALRARAVRGVRALAIRAVAHRDEVYAVLYELLGPEADLRALQPFERCALLAGTLGQANTIQEQVVDLRRNGLDALDPAVAGAQERRTRMLDRAIAIARPMMTADYPISADLHAEATFNLGVALHQRGRRLEAAGNFLGVVREHPGFVRGPAAGTYAVQLAWDMHQDRSLARRTDVQELYLDAMTALTDAYPDSEAGRYWRFFLAQYLAEMGRHDQAANEYARVDAAHERFHEAQYLAAEARALSLKRFASANPEETAEINRRAREAIRAARNAKKTLSEAAASRADPLRQAELQRLAARATLLAAEVYALEGVGRWMNALKALDGFETSFQNEPALMGRVLRVRMIALEGSGRHEEASALIPLYVANDPGQAAATLQGLFDTLGEEIKRDKDTGRAEQARARAESAFVIARGMYELARDQPDLFGPEALYTLRLQLAEAALEKEDYERAKVLFEQCYTEDSARQSTGQPQDSRAIRGTAEAYFGLGRHAEALPLFNRIFRSVERGQRLWWKALLRDLQCRTELSHEPEVIIKSIRQQKFFDREMGGPDLRRRFDALLTANERRAEAGG